MDVRDAPIAHPTRVMCLRVICMCEALCGHCEGAPSAERAAEGDTEWHAATKKTTKELFVASRPGTRQQFPCHARCVLARIFLLLFS